jgi:Protein of unknown function (DUF1592)/Protein of unknown function (DUF1588)/Protein of unknown function (DUF1587)/Protein of unknown function (DUF1595)/Protein of unknown function (DUF1585)/Ca-dependent carbohydrate-binding module xylan-binding/Planctomycete cytochrome C
MVRPAATVLALLRLLGLVCALGSVSMAIADESALVKPTADKLTDDKPTAVQPTADKPTADRPANDRAPAASATDAAAKDFFAQSVQPFLARHCYACHSGKSPKAKLDLKKFRDTATVGKDREVWAQVVEYLEGDIMPPEERPRPNKREVESVTRWLSDELAKLDDSGRRDPGRVTIRRLNRAEYNNTIRDLVGVDFRPADDFPSDDVGYGFDSIGDVLSMPPILLEKYLAAAEQIVDRAIVVPRGPKRAVLHTSAKNLSPQSDGERHRGARMLNSQGELFTDVQLAAGKTIVRVKAYGEQAGDEPVRMALRVDGKDLKTVDVKAVAANPEVYEARLTSPGGKHRVSAAFVNDYYRPDDPDPKQRDRNLAVQYIDVEGLIDTGPRPLTESHRRIIFRRPAANDTPDAQDQCAREILTRFVTRAYRRPATDTEIERLVRLVRLAREQGDPFEKGIQLALEAVLVSPHFLFRVELDGNAAGGDGVAGGVADGKAEPPNSTGRASQTGGAVRPLNDYQLASRLSYFLWSSMPDDELFALAAAGTLGKDGNIEAQTKRLLADPKSRALVDNFASQWLQIRNLSLAAPNRQQFPDFDESLRRAMQKETEMFFESILREDRSVLDFLDADYTFVNERLAKHYGIAGVKGDEFRRVTLSDPRRGGILTQASVLTITSNPTRTSPVKRGRWILEQILGTPPPPPPPDVPELEQVKLAGSLRQRMEQHRANPRCATCHARMDPLGFGLENFDAVGAWREKDGDYAIDASGTLPGGKSFSGPVELRRILKGRHEQFCRNLVRKLLTYALGRGLESNDNHTVNQIVSAVEADGYKFSTLVVEIAKSEPFRLQRGLGTVKE